ncbi:porin family protein [Vibrio navarrensis]|nr:porin family protein [Vibrio navarrensis]EJL6568322.1 porin family protein [Vibrio navarrensis]
MKKSTKIVFSVASLMASNLVFASDAPFVLKALLGSKSLESAWDKDDEMDTIGFQMTYFPGSTPFGIALDLYGSGNEEEQGVTKSETTVAEANLGIRWQADVFSNISLLPYLGAGISLVEVEKEIKTSGVKTTYDDNGVGYWIGGGLDYAFSNSWSIGFDVHYSKVDVKINSKELDAGGINWALSAGYRF